MKNKYFFWVIIALVLFSYSSIVFGQSSVLIDASSSTNGFRVKSFPGSGRYGTFTTASQTGTLFFKNQETGSPATGNEIGFIFSSNYAFNISSNVTNNIPLQLNNVTIKSSGTLNIDHNTLNNINTPHLTLETPTNASFGIIKMQNYDASRFFGQYFGVTSPTAANNFISWDYNGTNPMLTLYGNGNAVIPGFTKLGSEASAPKIKMKELALTSDANSGGITSIAHDLTQSKILSVSIFINATTGNDIPPNSSYTSFKYDYYVSSSAIYIQNISGNDTNIKGRPVRILITYKE